VFDLADLGIEAQPSALEADNLQLDEYLNLKVAKPAFQFKNNADRNCSFMWSKYVEISEVITAICLKTVLYTGCDFALETVPPGNQT